jgi:hypothetical protein
MTCRTALPAVSRMIQNLPDWAILYAQTRHFAGLCVFKRSHAFKRLVVMKLKYPGSCNHPFATIRTLG